MTDQAAPDYTHLAAAIRFELGTDDQSDNSGNKIAAVITLASILLMWLAIFSGWVGALWLLAAASVLTIIGLMIRAASYERIRKRNLTKLERVLEDHLHAALMPLGEAASAGTLVGYLGSHGTLLSTAAWFEARIDAATDAGFWNSDSTSEEVADLRDNICYTAWQSLRMIMALCLIPPARFGVAEEQAAEWAHSECRRLEELATRVERMSASEPLESGEAIQEQLLELVAFENARRELDQARSW